MPQPKGKSGNYSGKPKGTLNRSTKELRTVLTAALGCEIENIPNTLKKLEPKERLEILAKLIGYILPKPQPERDIESEFEHAEAIRHMVNTTMAPPNITIISENMSNEPD